MERDIYVNRTIVKYVPESRRLYVGMVSEPVSDNVSRTNEGLIEFYIERAKELGRRRNGHE